MDRWLQRLMSCACALATAGWLAVPGIAAAQSAPPPPTFKAEEIEALVAPIALYPDTVLSQVLMASTYPLEIVHAARWVKANPNTKGDAAVKAVEGQPWDVSVKSLVAFPQVLEPMSDKLDWTQKLGDAFLAQEKDVLAAVQRLRKRARDAGNLQSNEQQKVVVQQTPPAQGSTGPPPPPQTIVIESANPQVIYVPAYNPTVVYGAWGYPSYPPYYWPPYPAYYPGAALATGLAWGVGLAAAGAIFGNCNWGGGDVNINVNRATNIDRSFDGTKVQGGNKWQHDASHRQGVAYRDNASREKYGKNVSGADRRQEYRGREGDGAGDRAGASDRSADRDGRTDRGDRQAGDRQAGDRQGDRQAGDRQGDRQAVDRQAGTRQVSDRPASDRSGVADHSRSAGSGGRDNAFQGVGGGGGQSAQRDFDRGRASSQSAGFSGGAARGGGGGGFSGGGGRGGGGGGRGGRR